MACRLVVCTLLCSLGFAAECPKYTKGFTSVKGGDKAAFNLINNANVPIIAHWFNFEGRQLTTTGHAIRPEASANIQTYVGHAFRIYAAISGKPLLMEYTVESLTGDVSVVSCDGVKADDPMKPLVSPRAAEFEKLAHDQDRPCLPAGKSGQWSCINRISKDDYAKRSQDGTTYGFATKSEAGHRGIGATVDSGYTRHIPSIPRLTTGRGYMKMTFTDELKKILVPWYKEVRKGGAKDANEEHPPIPGGYTNSNDVAMSKIDLDNFRHIQRAVANEMQDILEWWTGRVLTHTSTFGVRIYHRDSMLINHVDRSDTHLASAVIQIAQKVDEDGGWPLEVMDADGNASEIYLQENELVLYEGARFRHGRPMRFVGDDFANIFSHFSPLDWKGAGKSPHYDGLLDADGFLPAQLKAATTASASKEEL